MKLRLVVLSLALVTLTSAAASAAPVTVSAGGSFSVHWACVPGACQSDNGELLPLTAEGLFVVTEVGNGYLEIQATITNSWNDPETTLFLTGMGFDVDPNATSVSARTEGFYLENFALNQKFPGFQTVEVCADTQLNGSCGAHNGGIPEGLSDFFVVRLQGNYSVDQAVTFDNFAIKMAGEPTSYEFGGTPVPEPASMLLLGTGLLGTGFLARRRRR